MAKPDRIPDYLALADEYDAMADKHERSARTARSWAKALRAQVSA